MVPNLAARQPPMKWLATAVAVLAGSGAASCPSSEFQVRVAHLRAHQLYPWSEIDFVGDHGTVDDPIIITGARSNAVGVLAEREWLDERWWRYRIREQRLMPRGDRFLDVLEVEVLTESPGMTTVVFDVTGFYGGGADLGAWRFVDWLGRTTEGTIESAVASWDAIDESWQEGVQSQTGFLVYQVDDGINDGLTAAGPIVSGKRHGEWQMLQERTGLTVTRFTAGVKNGTERIWDAGGQLRCELDWRDGQVVETRVRTPGGEMVVKEPGPIR